VDMVDLVLAILGSLMVGGASYLVRFNDVPSLSRRLRLFLLSLAGGLVGYSAYGLDLPGSEMFRRVSSDWGALLMCLLFSLLPVGYELARQARNGLQGGRETSGAD
jgi:hypothetical protein